MKKKFYLAAVLMIIFVSVFILCIQPVKKFSYNSTGDSISVKEILQNELLDSISGILQHKTEDFAFDFSEKDINSIITEKISKSNYTDIYDIQCKIIDEEVVYYINTKLFSFIPTQVIMKTSIDVIDNEIDIKINKAYLGRIPIAKTWILKILQNKMNSYGINTYSSGIKIPITLPRTMSIKEFRVSDSMSFNIKVSIETMDDLVEIFSYFGKKINK